MTFGNDPYNIDLDQLDLGGADSQDLASPPSPEDSQASGSDEPVNQELLSDEPTAQELYEVLVNGQNQQVSLDDLKKGFMMQSDYTKKTSEHSQTVKDWETQKEQYLQDQMQEQYGHLLGLENLFNQYPGLENGVVQYIQQQMQQGTLQQSPQHQFQQMDISTHPQFQQMQEQLQTFQQQQEQQAFMENARQEMNRLVTEYPEAAGRESEIAQFVDDYNNQNPNSPINLDIGYKLMTYNTVKQTTQQDMVKNQMKRQQKSQPKPQVPSGQSAGEPTSKPKTYADIERMLLSGGDLFAD